MSSATPALEPQAGSAAVGNLLRLVLQECDAAVAFAALPDERAGRQIFALPAAGTEESLPLETFGQLVDQLAADPELPHSPVLVRAVDLPGLTTVAVAPVLGRSPSVVAVLGRPGWRVDESRLGDVLQRVADRLSCHVEARRAVGAASRSRDPASEPSSGADARAHGAAEPAVAPPGLRGALASQLNGRGRGASEAGGGTEGAWSEPDVETGLPALAAFFANVGKLLGSEERQFGVLAFVLVEVSELATAPAAARALRAQLRGSDPVARLAPDLFAAAALLLPGSTRGDALEARIAEAVRAALDWLSPVRTAHVLVEPGDRRQADEILRHALGALSGREAGGGGAPWRGAGGSAARLPFP